MGGAARQETMPAKSEQNLCRESGQNARERRGLYVKAIVGQMASDCSREACVRNLAAEVF